MNTTLSTILLATFGIFMFSLSCFGQESGPPTFSVLERDTNGLSEVESDPGMESMLLTPVEDSDVETHASKAEPTNLIWEEFQRWFRCNILRGNLKLANEWYEEAVSEWWSVILDPASSEMERKMAKRRADSALAAKQRAQKEWDESGCGCAR